MDDRKLNQGVDAVNMDHDARRAELLRLIKETAFIEGDVTLASGKKSTFYIDGKQVTLNPKGAYLTASLILDLLDDVEVDAIGGPAIGADPILGAMAVLCFERGRNMSFFMVRKEPKGHGRRQLIEGPPLRNGSKVVVLEDVVTTGGSIVRAIDAVKGECDAMVVKAVAIVDREEGAEEALRRLGIPLCSVFKARELV